MEESLDQLVEELGAALAAPDAPRRNRNEPALDKKWVAGDIAKRIPREQLDLVAEKCGTPVGILRSYAELARAIPPEERRVKAAWSVYREARDLSSDERAAVLRHGMTLRQIRVALGKGDMDRPRKERLTDEARAEFVIDELQEPSVRAIVERETQSSSASRRARRAARTTLDEIAARKKFIEAEIRKLQKEGTPDRQYWVASKELVEAEQFIHSVARLHDRHGDAMTDDRWAEIIQRLRHLADAALDVAARIEGLSAGGYIELEGEDVPDYLELAAGAEIADAEVVEDHR